MAIGEDADGRSLVVRSRTHGLKTMRLHWRDEDEALRLARGIVAHLHWPRLGPGPSGPADPPLFPAEELLGIASVDVRVPFDVREILARFVDGSRFEEFKASYGAQLVCGWTSLGVLPWHRGCQRVPLLPRRPEGAQLVSSAIEATTPILFVQNITRISWLVPITSRAGSSRTGQADQRRVEVHIAPPHPHGGCQLWHRQLRHGRSSVRPALRRLPGPTTALPSWVPSSWPVCSRCAAQCGAIVDADEQADEKMEVTETRRRSSRSTTDARPAGCGTTASSTLARHAPSWPSR